MQDFWRRVVADHDLKIDQLATLTMGCEAWERKEQARLLIDRDGPVVAGRRHPAVDIENQSQVIFLRAMGQLQLDAKPDGLADLF
jgi:hypothetical protein